MKKSPVASFVTLWALLAAAWYSGHAGWSFWQLAVCVLAGALGGAAAVVGLACLGLALDAWRERRAGRR